MDAPLILFPCILCEAIFKNKSILNKHIELHNIKKKQKSGNTQQQKPHSSSECDQTFNHEYELERHMKNHNGYIENQCPQCEQRFAENTNLQIHMKTHTSEKHSHELTTSSPSQLNIQVHIKKPNNCEICDKNFKRNSQLQQHNVEMHAAEKKPHVCPVCGKCFALPHHLTRHLNTHTGHKPWRCEECGRCFPRSDHLRVHMKLKHKQVIKKYR